MTEPLLGFTFNHADQPDRLSDTMTPAEVKAAFDSRGEELRVKVNEIVFDHNLDMQQYANVKSFGATGDGETDDTDSFNDAISNVSSSGGGVVFIPFGTYLISDKIIMKSNVHLMGVDAELSIIKSMSSNSQINFTSVQNSSLQKLTYDGDNQGTGYNFIWVRASDYIDIIDCHVKNTVKAGIWIDDLSSGYDPSTNIRIKHCIIEDVGTWSFNGVAVVSGDNVLIDNCEFINCSINLEPAASTNYIGNINITKNIITPESTEKCIQIYGYFRDTWGKVTVGENKLSNGKKGILVNYTDADIHIFNNVFNDLEIGVCLSNTIFTDGIVDAHISIYNNDFNRNVCALFNNKAKYYFNRNNIVDQSGNTVTNVTTGSTNQTTYSIKGVIHNYSDLTANASVLSVEIKDNSFQNCSGVDSSTEFYMVYTMQIPTVVFSWNTVQKCRGIIGYTNSSGNQAKHIHVEFNKVYDGLQTSTASIWLNSYVTVQPKEWRVRCNEIFNAPYLALFINYGRNALIEGNTFDDFGSGNNNYDLQNIKYTTIFDNTINNSDSTFVAAFDASTITSLKCKENYYKTASSSPNLLVPTGITTLVEAQNIVNDVLVA